MMTLTRRIGNTVGMISTVGCFSALMLTSCTTVTPQNTVRVTPTRSPQYQFFGNQPKLKPHQYEMYGQELNTKDDLQVQLAVTQPSRDYLAFQASGNELIDLSLHPEYILIMEPGVYPFEIRRTKDKGSTRLTGAMFVYNVTNTLSLATLGRTSDTATFANSAIREAANGKIASYTLSFDDKPVATYYMGNRTKLFPGGEPTAQLDFSGNPDISELIIDGKKVSDYSMELPIYKTETFRTASGDKSTRSKPAEYKFQFTSEGTTYHGFFTLLQADEYTAFVRLDCTIPPLLMARARQGTVAKYTIKNADEENIVKLFLSEKTN